MTHHGGAPPGWYDDATGSGTQRWWDGQRWTDHLGPGLQQPAQYPQPVWPGYYAPPARRRRSRGIWVLPLVVAVVLGGGTIWYYTFGGPTPTEWYQEGYDVGKDKGIGESRFIETGSPEVECDMLLSGKIKFNDSNNFRARELKRGCVQAIKDKNEAKRP